jgi:predicted nucleotidyltransferase component of viral defense system
MNTPREYIELFHLLFLEYLSKSINNQLYALKGGCNLRFFFKSQRYSEDLDIDVQTVAVETLKNKIDKLLTSVPFKNTLKTHHMNIIKISTPKQTNTTQRWKIALQTTTSVLPLNTKIEFSRRGMTHAIRYEAIDPIIIEQYHLTPILCTHYSSRDAFIQKIEALAGRPQTQARDIFDLFLLLHSCSEIQNIDKVDTNIIERAQYNALSITFSDFKSQVIAFLMPTYQAQYDSLQQWEYIATQVVNQLELLKP